MADLYSVIAGIQPDQQDILEAELLAKQILEANFPNLDLREGTGIRDLTIRPAAFILSLCKKGLDVFFDQRTISNIDNTSSTETVDSILANLFLTRNLGIQAVINVRLYFARQKAITLTTNTSFSTDGKLLFFPVISTTYPSSALQLDVYQNEYYIDVDLIAAEKGTDYNIGSGSLLYFSNFDPLFLHGEINYLAQASTSPETNSEFIARASTAISTRNLINKPSIDSALRQEFNILNRVVTVGAGDPEIFRDQVEVLGSVGISRLASSMSLTNSNTKMSVVLPNHGFILGQLVNVIEFGPVTAPNNRFNFTRVPVTDIVDTNTFKISTASGAFDIRSFSPPNVAPVELNTFVHQGGSVDVYCAEDLSVTLTKVTLDSTGKAKVQGPNYKILRSAVSSTAEADTVPANYPFTVTFPGHSTRSDISLSQAVGTNVLTLTASGHCLTEGLMVNITGWPSISSDLYLQVSDIVDENNVVLGRNLPNFVVETNANPQLKYVYPRKDTGFSTRQELVVDFGSAQAGKTATLELYHFNDLDSIQNYLELSENRVICADLLARGFDIYILDIDLVVYDTVAPSTGECSSIISSFLKSLTPGQEFILADLVAELTAKGITKLKTPLAVTYRHYTKELFPVQAGVVRDVVKPLNSHTIFTLGNIQSSIEST